MLVSIEVFPFPKFHEYCVASVEELVKETKRGAQPELLLGLKLAVTPNPCMEVARKRTIKERREFLVVRIFFLSLIA